jgi:hypothetical protein
MPKPYSWDYLNRLPGPNEVFGPFSTAFVVTFLVGFFLAAFLYNEGGRHLTTDPIRRRYLRKYAGFLLVPLVLGLLFFGVRILQIDPFTFGRRIWLYLSLLGLLGVLAYAGLDIQRHYRRDVAAQRRVATRGRYVAGRTSSRVGSSRR